MTIIYTIASVLAILFVAAEFAAAVILYRRRHEIGPRLRELLGINALNNRVAENAVQLGRLDRKVNYVGRHVKFERDQLRRMGILKDEKSRMDEAAAATVREVGSQGVVHTFPKNLLSK